MRQQATLLDLPNEADLSIAPFSVYDLIIDARTAAEYADDHLPGAVSLPVMDTSEQRDISLVQERGDRGLYTRAMTKGIRRVSRHLDDLMERGDPGKVLVYCLRGGKRSKIWADALKTVDVHADILPGGWRSYRNWVVLGLETCARSFEFRTIAGPTAVGKTRLLQALALEGAQILDLEEVATHRGSMLGDVAEKQQSQKMFEAALLERLRRHSLSQPVWVEFQTRRMGSVMVPPGVWEAMRAAETIVIETSMQARVGLCMEDYDDVVSKPDAAIKKMKSVGRLIGAEEANAWEEMAAAGEIAKLVQRVLERYYDKSWGRSKRQALASGREFQELKLSRLDQPTLKRAARMLIRDNPKRAF
jgi:tRNA 2-selenouridine synthase